MTKPIEGGFIVMGNRSANSVLGAANRPCKGPDGLPQRYATSEEAIAAAKEFNRRCTSPNIWYSVETAEC